MIYTIWVYVGIIVTGVILFLMTRQGYLKHRGSRVNTYLFGHVFVWFLFLVLELRWSYLAMTQIDFLRVLSIFDSLLFLPGLLFYAYLSYRFCDVEFKLNSIYWLPVVIHAIVASCLLALGKDYYGFLYDQRQLKLYYQFLELGILMYNGYFLMKSHMVFAKAGTLHDTQGSEISSVRFLMDYSRILILSFVCWGVALMIRVLSDLQFVWVYELSRSILIGGLIYLVWSQWSQWEKLKFLPAKLDPKPSKRLDDLHIQNIKLKLEALIETDRIYMNDKLTLTELSNLSDTSPNDLSWVLNNSYGQSFYEFINRHRVNHFLEQIHGEAHLQRTILSLAMESGFRSNATFYKAFKQETGQTPNEYIKDVNKNPLVLSR